MTTSTPTKDFDVTKRFNIQIHADHFQNAEPTSPLPKEKEPEQRLSVLNDSLTTNDPSSIALDERGSLGELTPNKRFLHAKTQKFTGQDDVPKSPLSALNHAVTDPEIKIYDKSEWINEDSCYVCQRTLEKLKGVNPHHCRICRHAVCGDCSRGRINISRACDACMKKQREKAPEQIRKDRIAEKDFEISTLTSELELKTEEFKEASRIKKEYAIETNKIENEHNKSKADHENQRQNADRELKEAKEEAKILTNNIENNKLTIRSKESLLSQIKLQARALKIEIGQKMAILDSKKEEFQALVSRKNAITEMAKGLNIQELQFGPQSSGKNRNFSLAANGNTGRYSISGQPVKI